MARALAFVLLVLLAACGPAASEAEPEPGVFDFSVAAVGGGQIEGAELAGRDVALWFWAPW